MNERFNNISGLYEMRCDEINEPKDYVLIIDIRQKYLHFAKILK